MNRKAVELNERAINIATQYKRAEVDLISILQEIDTFRAYHHFDCTSLYDYCVKNLKLSESTSYNLITVARKASEVPQLKEAIANGELTVSKARKLVPVLTQANKTEWLEFAKSQTSREIEKAVAVANPQLIIQESVRYRAEDRIELKIGISEQILKKLERVLDLESQRTSKPATKEQALAAALEAYLVKYDPVLKAERIEKSQRMRKEKLLIPSRSTDAGKIDPRLPKFSHRVVTEGLPATARNTKPVPGQVELARESVPPQASRAQITFSPQRSLRIRKALGAKLVREIRLRDKHRCAHRSLSGERCKQTRWLECHHVRPVSQGGDNSIDNLITLCSAHHRLRHNYGHEHV